MNYEEFRKICLKNRFTLELCSFTEKGKIFRFIKRQMNIQIKNTYALCKFLEDAFMKKFDAPDYLKVHITHAVNIRKIYWCKNKLMAKCNFRPNTTSQAIIVGLSMLKRLDDLIFVTEDDDEKEDVNA